MRGLVGELDDLVLDRRAVTWSTTAQVASIDGRFAQPFGNDRVGAVIGIGNATSDLRPVDTVGQVGKGLDRIVAQLLLQTIPMDRPAIKPRRGPGLQPTHIQAEVV